MIKYRIKYQKGEDIYVTSMWIREGIQPQYAFYMQYGYNCDILDISVVNDEA